jgi:Domain of unknown function (DUF4160)
LKNRRVPRLSAFYGIVIFMYRLIIRRRISVPSTGEHVAQITLDSFAVMGGSLPPRPLRLVREWAELHRGELTANWELLRR